MNTIIAIALVAAFLLARQRWFWMLAGWLGGIASGFTMLACIVSFQILAAMGFMILACLRFTVVTVATE